MSYQQRLRPLGPELVLHAGFEVIPSRGRTEPFIPPSVCTDMHTLTCKRTCTNGHTNMHVHTHTHTYPTGRLGRVTEGRAAPQAASGQSAGGLRKSQATAPVVCALRAKGAEEDLPWERQAMGVLPAGCTWNRTSVSPAASPGQTCVSPPCLPSLTPASPGLGSPSEYWCLRVDSRSHSPPQQGGGSRGSESHLVTQFPSGQQLTHPRPHFSLRLPLVSGWAWTWTVAV